MQFENLFTPKFYFSVKAENILPELAKILRVRYGQPNGSWDDLCLRVARTIAESEELRQRNCRFEQFYQLISQGIFIPAGRTLLAGVNPLRPSCCVLGYLTEDNYDNKIILSYKLAETGTGSGFNLSKLADPVQAIKEISAATAEATNNESRQSANICLLDVEHPRVIEFIRCKCENPQELSNVTLSVCISNAWMRSMFTGDIEKQNLLSEVANAACISGEPGIVFIDKVIEPIATPFGNPICCSPCGELFMNEFETCSLGAINLNAKEFLRRKNGEFAFNFAYFKDVVGVAVRFLDDVIQQYEYLDARLAEISQQTRRIGLGVAGFADLLKKLHLDYDSKEARTLGSQIAKTLTESAELASARLAKEKGGLKFNSKRRNISLTCIAPTGNISRILKELTGNEGYAIEPILEEAVKISPEGHLRMMNAWQPFIHNSISKTVNLASDCTAQDILEVWTTAFKCNCKGITVFRKNSRTIPNK